MELYQSSIKYYDKYLQQVEHRTSVLEERIRRQETQGYLVSQTYYQKLISTLSATGNSYDVEMEVKILDENIGKKSAWTSGTVIGENSSYSIGTTSIVEEITQKGSYSLKEGDVFIVRVKNTNKTLAQTIRGAIYTVAGSDNYSIAAEASGMVQANGSN